MGVTMSLPTHLKILLLASSAVFLGSCSSLAIHEAEAVVAQADSLWKAGLMYGIDAGDSLTLAQAYKTLGDIPLPFTGEGLCPIGLPVAVRRISLGLGSPYAHACYHYGKLLRAKDHPAEAMQAFINATHSRTRDYHILGRVYSNMGSICHLAGDFPLSYDMYERSANCFLADNDSLSYYFLLNDMAFEKAMLADKESCIGLLHNIEQHCIDRGVICKTLETKAELYLKCKQYDSVLYYASILCKELPNYSAGFLLQAQAYSYLAIQDSAIYYAERVLDNSPTLEEMNNALYILTNDDESKDKAAIRQTAADRSDTQKLIELRQMKISQAAQLLQQDLTRKPDWRWLYAVIATVLIIGAAIVIYVYRKHKKHDLLAQKISDLTLKSNAVQANHEKLVNRYESQHQRRMEETLHRCALLRNCPQIAVELKWSDFDAACSIIDSHFYLLASKLRQKAVLNETEIRLCILVLIGLNRIQIANTMPYALNSIGKLKDQTAKKLGTSGKNLRDFLIKMVVDE